MIPLLFASQGATAPVGGYGGITITQSGAKWLGTPWYGGRNLSPTVALTFDSEATALQTASIILTSYIANLSDVDPDN